MKYKLYPCQALFIQIVSYFPAAIKKPGVTGLFYFNCVMSTAFLAVLLEGRLGVLALSLLLFFGQHEKPLDK